MEGGINETLTWWTGGWVDGWTGGQVDRWTVDGLGVFRLNTFVRGISTKYPLHNQLSNI